jgi:hypothetical protein
MRRAITIAITLLALSIPVFSQSQTSERRGHFYGVVGPGVGADAGDTGGTVQFGFGGEGLLTQSAGIGGEIAYLAPVKGVSNGFGIASVMGGYHFRKEGSDQKVIPFASGGYSLFFRENAGSGINFGGGVNYWMKGRVGLRFEVRDYMVVLDGVANLVTFRVGILFR